LAAEKNQTNIVSNTFYTSGTRSPEYLDLKEVKEKTKILRPVLP